MSRPGLTRKLLQQYRMILGGDASMYFYPHHSTWMPSNSAIEKRRSNAWQAYLFAKAWYGRDIDVHRLQVIVTRTDIAEPSLLFSRDVPGANRKRLERHVMAHGTAEELRRYAACVPGANVRRLNDAATVREVLDDVMTG